MFDAQSAINVKILSGTVKTCSVRWPSDSEWLKRSHRQKLVVLNGGGSEDNSVEANAALFKLIRTDVDAQPFDDDEASLVIERLETMKVEHAEVNCQSVALTFKPAFARHRFNFVMNLPTIGQQKAYEKSLMDRERKGDRVILRANLKAIGELYDTLHVSHDGYAGEVPIVHKYAAVNGVMVENGKLIARMEEEEDPEE